MKESFDRRELMTGIKIYTINSKKMIKKGLPGWNADQEQAKTYFASVKKDDRKYKVKITDENMIEEIFALTSISEEKRNLDINDFGMLISIRYIGEDNYCMTIYYHPQDGHVEHYNVSNYVKCESDYGLADKIVKWINENVS